MSMLARLATLGGGRPLPEFVSSSTNKVVNTSNTVTAPTSIQNGDLLIALTYTVAAAGVTPPAGFSQIYTEQEANPFVTVNVKTAASESGNYTFTASASTDFTVVILVYRNATRINTLGGINRTSTASATGLSITPTFRGALLAAFSRNTVGTISSTPSGFTLREGPGAGIPYVRVYDKNPQEASATGNQSLVYSTTGTHSGIQLQITNEPTVAPEFVASASTSNGTLDSVLLISKPTGTIEGDLMVAVMVADAGVTWTGDTNWTEIADQGVSPSVRVAYKIAGVSEASSYTFTSSNPRRNSGSILTYRYAAYDTIGSFVTGTNPIVISSISPSQSQSTLIAIGARANNNVTLTTPTGMSALVIDNDQEGSSYIICGQVVSKGPTGTRSTSAASTNNVAGIMFAIKPTRSLS